MKLPRTLGRYEVVELIGRGGMGSLYRARDPRIGRNVAIKQLRPEFDTPELRDRFSREAAAAGSLSHPNIVTIYDVGEDEGMPFIAMEYVRGETFTDLMGLRPPLTVARKLQLVEEVCSGLAHAHEAGIIHRDIKPANLIVGSEGIVKILDFGIAKLISSGLTIPGMILGTLNYMAPEQLRGEPIDARADVFALGAVLYELLTHQQAFPGRAADEVFDRILKRAPEPMATYCPGLDPRLVAFVDRTLEKNPDDRVQEMSEFQRELSDVRLRPGVAAPARSTGTRDKRSGGQAGVLTPPPTPASGKRSTSSSGQSQAALRTQIDGHLAEAERACARGEYDAAIESCKRVLMLHEADPRALAQLDRIHAALDEQRARAEVAELEQQEAARVRDVCSEARRRFAAGEHEAAIRILEEFEGSDSTGLVGEVLEQLREQFRGVEEERRVRQERAERRRRFLEVLTTARAALNNGRLDDCARLIDQLHEIDPDAPDVTELTTRLQQARVSARLKVECDVILREFDSAISANELDRARERLDALSALAARDSRLADARRRLDQAVDAVAAQRAAEARIEEAHRRLDAASDHLERGELQSADDLVKAAAVVIPQEARLLDLWARIRDAIERRATEEAAERRRRRVAELIESATSGLNASGDRIPLLQAALRDVDEALTLDPASAGAAALKARIEEAVEAERLAARVKAVIANARARFANGKPQAALRLLEAFEPASHIDICSAIAEMREDLRLVEEKRRLEEERRVQRECVVNLLAEVHTAIGEQRLDAALDLLAATALIDAETPELEPLRARIEQARAAARLEAEMATHLAEFNARLKADDLESAKGILLAATELAATDPRIEAARAGLQRAFAAREAAAARARDFEAKAAAAQALFDRGDIQASWRTLAEARALEDAGHERTAALHARLEEAIAQQNAAREAEQQQQAADALVAKAAARLNASEVSSSELATALREIDEALALRPEHAGAVALKATADTVTATLKKAAATAITLTNARRRMAIGKYQSALQLIEKLDGSDPRVQQAVQEIHAAMLEQQQRTEQQRLAEKRRESAQLVTSARAAIGRESFSEALEALTSAQLLDPSVENLEALIEEARAGQRRRLAAISQTAVEDWSADDEGATRVIRLDRDTSGLAIGGNDSASSSTAVRSVDESSGPDDPSAVHAILDLIRRRSIAFAVAAAVVLVLIGLLFFLGTTRG